MTTPTATTPTPAQVANANNTNANNANANANANANNGATKINVAAANTAEGHGHHPAHVTWDEETIALHDKDRGTRMKIEEPKTPYHSYGADGDASPSFSLSGKEEAPPLKWNELQVKLAHVETKQQQKKGEWDSSDDEGAASPAGPRFAERNAEGKKVEKDPAFSAKRKSHYNEFQAMKMWRQAHAEEEEEGEGDEKDSGAEAEAKGAHSEAA